MTHLIQIGPFPPWIKELRASPDYKNVFEMGIDPPTVYGTEQLFGDWKGELLLVAQDFAPAHEVEALIAIGLSAEKVYRHNDGDGRYRTGYRTNSRLLKFLGRNRSDLLGTNASASGILYANACFFLKHGTTSDPLKDFRLGHPAFEGSVKVLSYVIKKMTNLKAIVCLGGVPYKMMLSTGLAQSIPLYNFPHPSRGSDESHFAKWSEAKNNAGLNCLK
ncbi:hypothetical protein [Asticcacaulis endophyticus]|uniref:Uracil DNA glycosylase superfamily protein n=1 Tax=Asticcacaulis endophyticus TaxID=1395890 RepID=A0A918Q8T3_9CAUL|nr:hypothetical protein [Asticcacaulis endophyticus]GGZ35887.1 hypothetical protein GCM10011273_22640 [Asticcacaulis endophyticus]